MAGRYTGTLPAYSIMSTGPGLPSRLEIGTEAYKRRREEELRQEFLRRQEELRLRPAYGARSGANPKVDPLTVEVTRRLQPAYQGPQYGRGGTPTQEELQRQMIINRNRAGLLNVRNQNAVPPAITESSMSGNMAKREEEEDNPYDRQFFGELIANAYAASLGGKPPTPYAQGVGTLRNFTALPFA
jgi:hypothetical protein|tara:strand:- start:139 stop:696 length:558 start_codon:yes stop_codon:yes gene_type:complete